MICSSEATDICQKNHLSFVELLLPFSHLSSEGKCFWRATPITQHAEVRFSKQTVRREVLLHVRTLESLLLTDDELSVGQLLSNCFH